MNDIRGPKMKLRRAKHHLNNLNGIVQRFIKAQPYSMRIENDSDPEHHLLWGRMIRRPRRNWGLLVGDFVHNARSALDHVIHEMSALPPLDRFRRELQFPICDTSEEYVKARRRHRLDGVCPMQEVIIEKHQPYNGPNGFADDALSLLRELNIADKHHVLQLLVVSGEHATVNISGMNFVAMGGGVIKLGDIISMQQVNNGKMSERESVVGKIFWSSRQDRQRHMHVKPTIQIKFGGSNPRIEGRNVIGTLRAILHRVERVIEELEDTI